MSYSKYIEYRVTGKIFINLKTGDDLYRFLNTLLGSLGDIHYDTQKQLARQATATVFDILVPGNIVSTLVEIARTATGIGIRPSKFTVTPRDTMEPETLYFAPPRFQLVVYENEALDAIILAGKHKPITTTFVNRLLDAILTNSDSKMLDHMLQARTV